MKEEEDFCFFAIGFEEVQYVCVCGGGVLCLFGCRWHYSGSPWSSGGVSDLTTGENGRSFMIFPNMFPLFPLSLKLYYAKLTLQDF